MPHATQHSDAATAELDSALRGGPFHLALRTAIAARGLPLQRVQHHLSRHGVKVGVTSLSYWQQGARRPQRPESLRAVRALEEILRLPAESLLRLLAESDGPPPARRAGARDSGVLGRLLAELDQPPDDGLDTVGHHERVRIGPRRELAGREDQHIVRALRDGVDRFVAVHQGDPGCAPERMTVHALENCRAGRVRRHHDSGVLVAELLFDTRLRAGDTCLFRYAVEDGTAEPSHEYARLFDIAGGQYALQVRFDAAALPARCHRFTRPSPTGPRGSRRDLFLGDRHHSVHLVEPRVRPGVMGIGWEWT
ncbi:hypothetical protein J7I94_32005 [Streptomyces sp. ISL-12]|uniref:hypothetical protein n=1 Tax=Streptomyces sp. ISL-12 TaxID=2819177 RepID=UPI001BEB5B88|nr:hypothetical protein [Streptomyces sp. ISL-12]MBT2415111.1 hypothetical protein [Streptomyces sp. ISL-12]